MNEELCTKPICSYYRNIYKRMVIWFGYSTPYWLCNMDEDELLKCILNLNMKPNMYLIFINVAIRIRFNNNRSISVLNEYKTQNPNGTRLHNRRVYYERNMDKIKEYNREYHKMKKMISGLNLFKKKDN